jgi:hypothetical protein
MKDGPSIRAVASRFQLRRVHLTFQRRTVVALRHDRV